MKTRFKTLKFKYTFLDVENEVEIKSKKNYNKLITF